MSRLGDGQAGKLRGLGELLCDGDVVGAQGRRHDGGRSGDDGGSGQRGHAGLTKHRVERSQKDDGQVGGAGHHKGEDVGKQEHHGDEDIGALDVTNGPRQCPDRRVVGADLAHVGGVAAKDEHDETGGGNRRLEGACDGHKRVKHGDATGLKVLDRNALTGGHGHEHEHDAHEEQGNLDVHLLDEHEDYDADRGGNDEVHEYWIHFDLSFLLGRHEAAAFLLLFSPICNAQLSR